MCVYVCMYVCMCTHTHAHTHTHTYNHHFLYSSLFFLLFFLLFFFYFLFSLSKISLNPTNASSTVMVMDDLWFVLCLWHSSSSVTSCLSSAKVIYGCDVSSLDNCCGPSLPLPSVVKRIGELYFNKFSENQIHTQRQVYVWFFILENSGNCILKNKPKKRECKLITKKKKNAFLKKIVSVFTYLPLFFFFPFLFLLFYFSLLNF